MPDPAPSSPSNAGPNCYQCRHFAVSWDPQLPYLCQLMGFKSRALPAIEVLRADGRFCSGFSAKHIASHSSPSRDFSGAAAAAPSRAPAGCSLHLSPEALAGERPLDLPDLRRLSTFRRTA